MQVVQQLAVEEHPWLRAKPLLRLLHILNSDVLTCRMVGGCVRDALLGREIIDIDLACSLVPEETMSRLEKAGVKVILTGLKHGTITAVIEKYAFEITSLRRDVETYGRHAKVAFTDDWIEDAKRRDFTFNALYLDEDGSLYDPCGGLKDLELRQVRFIGDGNKRITEDALRILRFFRFGAQIGDGKLDPKGLAACIANKNLIETLSGERLAQELFKTLKAENLLPIIKVMADSGVLAAILSAHRGGGHRTLETLNGFVRLEKALGRCDVMARLACLLVVNGGDVRRALRLSNKQSKILNRYMTHDIFLSSGMSRKDIRKNIYKSGCDVFIFALLQNQAHQKTRGDFEDCKDRLSYAESWLTPILPLQGRDLMMAGVAAGPEMGKALKKLEWLWMESDFTFSKEDLLQKLHLS
ncbi:MAG: CCA tRNA nucleotidyltransferase [Emcibacter sp.]|nr:CCA tRNA nucleotidyltransferase [Emcibacter sp.]